MFLVVMMKAGAAVRSREIFYKALVQTVLFYDSDIWVITDFMMKVLEGFNHHIARSITMKTSLRIGAEIW